MKIDLTVVGPELPLTLGLVDELAESAASWPSGRTSSPPSWRGRRSSRRRFMRKYGIPTAEAEVCTTRAEAEKPR